MFLSLSPCSLYMKLTTQEIHIGTPIAKCRELNDVALAAQGGGDAGGGGGYEPDIFDNLIYRYEEPNGMTRWDSPLFTVPFEDEHPPYEAIWDAVIGREGKARVVKPNMATALVCPLIPRSPFPSLPHRVIT